MQDELVSVCPVIELAKMLISKRSLTPDDAGCQNLLIERLRKLNFIIEPMNFENTRNLWAWRGEGKTFLFAGHTDVVATGDEKKWYFPPFSPTMHNGMLFGRGAADMKGSLAAMIVATERFVKKNPNHRGKIAFLITSDEEGSASHGTVKVIECLKERKEEIAYCLIGEPTSQYEVGDIIKNGRRGSLTLTLTIHGKQGHVAYPQLASNPIHHILPVLQILLNTDWDEGKKNLYFPPTSIQIVNITAGTGNTNVTPDNCKLQLNFRYNTSTNAALIEEKIVNILATNQLTYSAIWEKSGPPFLTEKGELLDAILKAVQFYRDITPKLSTDGGTSDGRFITDLTSQIIELGPVNATIHQINEHVNAADLQLLSRIYQFVLEKLVK